jgi:serine/threonine protein kinase
LEPVKPELATREGAETKIKEICEVCHKPLTKTTSGSVSTWLFKGLYCSCTETAATPKEQKQPPFHVGPIEEAWTIASSSAYLSAREQTQAGQTVSPAVKTSLAKKSVHANLRLVAPELENPEITGEANLPDLNIYPTDAQGYEFSTQAFPAGQIAQSDPKKLIGKTIDGYQVLDYIGKGSSGQVFKVSRDGVENFFALKIITPSLAFGKRHNSRFLAEAKFAKVLDHENIIVLHDAGVTYDDVPYLVTDYVEGERLSDILEEHGALTEQAALDVFIQICDALSHAHYMGVLHRDVKPSNVRINPKKQVKLVDCGVSKVLPDPTRETRYFTESGFEYGDARYMSPEQCRGAKTDHRSDIYSLGCLMYQCLSGKAPFSADKNSMLIYKHVKKRARTLSNRFPDLRISKDLENLVMRCLEKEPDDRYQSISDLRDDLEAIRLKKQVKRAFRKKLQAHGDRKDPLFVPEAFSAAVSSMWFGFSTTARVLVFTVAWFVVLFAILFTTMWSTFYRKSPGQYISADRPSVYLTNNSPASSFDRELRALRVDASELAEKLRQANSPNAATAKRFLADIDLAQKMHDEITPPSLVRDTGLLQKLRARLAYLKNTADVRAPVNYTSEIRSKSGKLLYVAAAGSSKAETLLAAINANVDLSGADLSRTSLKGITISGANLDGADFTSCDLRGATIKDTSVIGANFDYANMDHARFNKVNAKTSSFDGATMSGVTIVNSSLECSTLSRALVTNADVFGGNTRNAWISYCNFDNSMILDGGSSFSLDGTPERAEITKLKTDMENKFERLVDIPATVDPANLPMPGSTVSMLLPSTGKELVIKPIPMGTAENLNHKIDAASLACETAISEARKLRRAEIVSAKANQKTDWSAGLKNLRTKVAAADAQIAKIEAELKTFAGSRDETRF